MNARTARIVEVLDSYYGAGPNESGVDYCLECTKNPERYSVHHLLYAVLFQNGVAPKEYVAAMKKVCKNHMSRGNRPVIMQCLSRSKLVEILELIPYEEDVSPSEAK